jgi:catechol 2,3-dioxygenase-like lactoylglutathione lyase family enzyme
VNAKPQLLRVYETSLYAHDLEATATFYKCHLGLQPIEGLGELGVAFRLGAGLLLIFDPDLASAADRPIPPHGTTGPGHVAFAVAPGALDAFGDALRAEGVEIEREVNWPAGGRSLYVRDPAGNSVELVDGEIWP